MRFRSVVLPVFERILCPYQTLRDFLCMKVNKLNKKLALEKHEKIVEKVIRAL